MAGLDKYTDRSSADRQATMRAIEDVWERVPLARQRFGGLVSFSMYAVAQKRFTETSDGQAWIALAEECMRLGGYEIDTPGRSGARRWRKASNQK